MTQQDKANLSPDDFFRSFIASQIGLCVVVGIFPLIRLGTFSHQSQIEPELVEKKEKRTSSYSCENSEIPFKQV